MATAPLFSAAGEPAGEFTLGDALFAQAFRRDLIHQAVETELWNRRQGTSSAKNRAAVRGGGRKPYRQKGTGRARQGSIRAPHYRHGGVVHGPVPSNPERAMPQKMRRLAFKSALSLRATEGCIRVLESLEIAEISTKAFSQFLSKLDHGKKTVLVLSQRDEKAALSARNIPNVKVIVLPGLSTREIFQASTLVFTRDAMTRLEELYQG